MVEISVLGSKHFNNHCDMLFETDIPLFNGCNEFQFNPLLCNVVKWSDTL